MYYLYEFKDNEIIHNQVVTYPDHEIFVHNTMVYRDRKQHQIGGFTVISSSYVNLYEMNSDRLSGSTGIVFPYVTKDSGMNVFKTVSTSQFNTLFDYGDTITGSYDLTSSLSRLYYAASDSRSRITALKNTLNNYVPFSEHYAYSSSLGDKSTQALNLVTIPSIYYGSSIKKGSVKLQYYITGTLVGELEDIRRNGELVQTGPSGSTGSGSVAGVVLYNEGFFVMTGSWNLTTQTYLYQPSNMEAKWLMFGHTMFDGVSANVETSSSFAISFKGTNYVPTVTMFAHAPRGHLDFSNNPTYIAKNQIDNEHRSPTSGAYYLREREDLQIKTTVSAAYKQEQSLSNLSESNPYSPLFEKATYITKIGIYDENQNLIAIASVARPVRKRQKDDYTFKLKLDF